MAQPQNQNSGQNQSNQPKNNQNSTSNNKKRNPQYKKKNPYYKSKTSKGGYRKEGFYKKKYHKRPELETIDDIKKDIYRIEKEIRLEIEEIKSMKI